MYGNTVTYYSGFDPINWSCGIRYGLGYVQWKYNNSNVICGYRKLGFETGSLALENAGTYICEMFPESCDKQYINSDEYCNITALNNECSPILSTNITVVIIGK